MLTFLFSLTFIFFCWMEAVYQFAVFLQCWQIKKITNFLHVNYEPNSTDGNNVLITSAWLHTRQYPESSYSWCKVQETSSGSPMCVVHFFCFHPIVSLWNSYPKCLMESCFLPFLCSLIQIHVWLWNLMFICQYLISCYSGR